MTSRTKKKFLIVIWIVIFFAVIGLGYSLYITLSSDATSTGVIACPEGTGECFWVTHTHAYIPIYACGEEVRLPFEKGPLTGPHTHEERNIIHWHDRLPYDLSTKTITVTEPLTLGAFFDALEIPFGTDRIQNFVNGDLCPNGEPGQITMFVNNATSTEFRSHIWKDQEVIVIYFDSRSEAELLEELKILDLEFPKLGRG